MKKPESNIGQAARPWTRVRFLALALAILMPSPGRADVVYLQPFINPRGAEISSIRAGWYTHRNPEGEMAWFSALGKVTGAASVAPVPPTEPANPLGYLMAWGPSHQYGAGGYVDHLFWTDQVCFENTSTFTAFRWAQRNTSTTDTFHPALQVGGQWYVADAGYAWGDPSVWQDEEFLFAGASWRLLHFQIDTVLELGESASLPTDQLVTGVGLFMPEMTDHSRFDNFEVDASPSSVIESPLVYRETFPNNSGLARAIVTSSGGTEGWKIHKGSTGTAYDGATIEYKWGCPAVPPINASPEQEDLTYGYLYSPALEEPTNFLYWTEEYEVTDTAHVEKIQWYESLTSDTEEFRLALRIGEDWYVSDAAFTNDTGLILCRDPHAPTWSRNELSLDDTTWQLLNFEEDVQLTMSGVPATLPTDQPITAWGLYAPENEFLGSDAQRFDNFTIFGEDVSPAIPGDTDHDGDVDADDATTVANHWGSTTATGPEEGDFNADGLVNAADASILAANWTGSRAESQGTGVPEPSTLVLLVGLSLVVWRRRRGSDM